MILASFIHKDLYSATLKDGPTCLNIFWKSSDTVLDMLAINEQVKYLQREEDHP